MKFTKMAITSGLITAASLAAFVAPATSAFAAENDPAVSGGKIEFVTDETSEVKPVDPTDPGTEVDPGDGGGTGNTGALAINYASHIGFGIRAASPAAQTYHALAVTATPADGSSAAKYVPHYVQLTDRRGAEATAWQLSVKQDADFAAGAEALTGAELSFNFNNSWSSADGTTKTPLTVADNSVLEGDTQITTDGIKVANSATTGTKGTIVLPFGADTATQEKVYADGSDGKTAPVDTDVDGGVSLLVPAGSAKAGKTYAATVTWTLADTIA